MRLPVTALRPVSSVSAAAPLPLPSAATTTTTATALTPFAVATSATASAGQVVIGQQQHQLLMAGNQLIAVSTAPAIGHHQQQQQLGLATAVSGKTPQLKQLLVGTAVYGGGSTSGTMVLAKTAAPAGVAGRLGREDEGRTQ